MATQQSSSKADDKVTVEDLRADLDQLRGDMAKLTEQLRESAKERIHEAEAAAKQKAKQVKDEALHQVEAGNEWLHVQMKERPMTVLGVAFAVGLLLGRTMRR